MEFQPPIINLSIVFPVLVIMGTGILLMMLNLFIEDDKHRFSWIALAGIVVALVSAIGLWGYEGGTFTVDVEPPLIAHPMIVVDNFATFLNVTLLATGFLTILISTRYLERTGLERPEFYMLLLFSLSGMMLMGMSNDLIMTFLALELLSIPLYIMAGLAVPRPDSEESAMKYFLLGAFSSGIFVYGIALTYGATGSTSLPVVMENAGAGVMALAGMAFVLVGFAFKVAAAPFHMWTPDVYEGAPTAVTAFMSVGAKVAGFAAMLRVLTVAFSGFSEEWMGAVAIIAALTLIVGNVVAITQTNIKRMLGYSSIAHAGYILIGVAAAARIPGAVGASLFYAFAYLFTTLGAFGVIIALEHKLNEGVALDDYKGLGKRSPLLAAAMVVFMLSFAGVPPTGGFSAKFYIFRSAIEAELWWLALIGIVTSVVGAYYYLRVVYLMYMFDGKKAEKPQLGWALATAVTIGLVVTLILGFFPAAWFDIAHEAVIGGVQMVAGG